MKTIDVEVLVIGGGATGTGVLRDLAMRGFRTALVERRDLTHGTTGRYHGLLHSGGRYVVKDPQAARECIEENRILRKIIPHCIEDTDGFFVTTPWDDPAYGNQFLEGCRQAGIPVEEISIDKMLHAEPLLNPSITRCFRVPDASADSFAAAEANVESARQYGAQVFTYHEVRRLLLNQRKVAGAVCLDLVNDQEVQFNADIVVNAAGAWSGKVAGTAGVIVQIKPGKGTMLAINHRIVNTVINRCKMPADGDILVPAHTVSVIGTTDEQVSDPDHFAIEPWEVELMLEEGEKLIPGFKEMRVLRAWAGVRPLYQETTSSASRDITRAFVLLDHESRDGLSGLVTITSGKWTTYRKMAEVTVDKVCEKLQVSRPCRTHLEPIPAHNTHSDGHHYLGSRLAAIEEKKAYGTLVCECELVSQDEITHAITLGATKTLDDVRRDTRLGMGPCQGGFCTLRAAGLLHQLRSSPIEEINLALKDFLQERWKGLLPILWGQQLRQERLDELVYLNVLNSDHLPGGTASKLASENYKPSKYGDTELNPSQSQASRNPEKSKNPQVDLLVIGAGLAGLASAWFVSTQEKKVRLISKGWGALYWGSGCIDVLGYSPDHPDKLILEPEKALVDLIQRQPNHPYALVGLETLREALISFQALCTESGYPLLSVDKNVLAQNWLIPTTIGSLRPTCLAPLSMIAGDCSPLADPKVMLLVGFQGFLDFFPELAAANLVHQGVDARAVMLDLPQLKERNFLTSRLLAGLFEEEAFRSAVVKCLKDFLKSGNFPASDFAIGFPAVLGIDHAALVWQDMQEQLRCPVFELPGLPPSIPGIRLHRILTRAIEQHGGRVYDGMLVVESQADGSTIQAVYSEAAARLQPHRAANYILATGGFLGGGLIARSSGVVDEIIFHLPVELPTSRNEWYQQVFLAPGGHPIFSSGTAVNQHLQPRTDEGSPIYQNLYAVGAAITGIDSVRERSLEGVALATAYAAASNLSANQEPGKQNHA